MPVGRLQFVTAIVMAYAVLLILVSPAVPSPLTTLRSKHTIQPPQFLAPVSALLFTSSSDLLRAAAWMSTAPESLSDSSPEIVDLTTARLC